MSVYLIVHLWREVAEGLAMALHWRYPFQNPDPHGRVTEAVLGTFVKSITDRLVRQDRETGLVLCLVGFIMASTDFLASSFDN